MSLSPGNEQQFYWGSEIGKKDGSRNYAGVDSPVVDGLIEKLISAKTRKELTTAIHALDRVLLWGHYVIPLYHSNTLSKAWIAVVNSFLLVALIKLSIKASTTGLFMPA